MEKKMSYIVGRYGKIPENRVSSVKLEKYADRLQEDLIQWDMIEELFLFGTMMDEKRPPSRIEPGVYVDKLRSGVLVIDVDEIHKYISQCSSRLKKLCIHFIDATHLKGTAFPVGLQKLDLSWTGLKSLDGITLPDGLQELALDYAGLVSLDGVILPASLKVLNLSHTPLQNLDGVDLPKTLVTLYLFGTKIRRLPETLRYLRGLKELSLSRMELDDLPYWLCELELPFTRNPGGSAIRLWETTIKDVDMSIFDQSQEAILQWFEERKKAKEEKAKPLNELKVVFLGDGEAGKSHTIARLLNDGIQVDKFRGVSTPGIVIEDKEYQVGSRQVKVHYWDFGGQEILHSMHRMFLTERTLYVVMLNVREGNQDDRARYWLHNLRSFANGAPVLLVLNKMDMNKNASVNESDLRKLYPKLTEIVKLSTKEDSEAEFNRKFRDVLLGQIGKMDILDYSFIPAWSRLKNKLQNMTENYIKGGVFRDYCDDCGVRGSDAVRRDLLNWFSDLGVSFCYSDKDKPEDYVVLRPDWITNAIYIILFNKIEAVTNGLVTHDTIYRMLSSGDTENVQRTVVSATYTREEVDYVLNVIRKFRLSFPVENERTEFMPMLCNANSTAAAEEYEKDPDALEFRMHYDYLPNNVIHRLMVDHRKELDQSNVWLTGARFVCGDTGRSAVVKSEGNLLRIFVRAEGEIRNPQRYLDELKTTLERINTEMGLTVGKMEVAYKENGRVAYFNYGELLFAQDIGETQILCMELRKKVLLADVLMQSDYPEDENQKKLMCDIRQACARLQDRKIYWDAKEDDRTDFLMDQMEAAGYFVQAQKRVGISEGGIQSGELDLDIRLNPGDCWSALEALNLTGSSDSQIKYWNAHLKKLLSNYNHVGRSFLFHVSYVLCKQDRFDKVCAEMYEHLRFYSPPGFEVQRRFVHHMAAPEDHTGGFISVVKAVYDCGGIPMTVYHFFVRIGE